MRTCLGCGAELVRRTQKAYCSVSCWRDRERRQRVALWLESGEAYLDSAQGHYVRLHLMREQGGTCAVCTRPAVWNGKPLGLVIDHVDGDAENNRRENLRLVCPNCDSQLPTFKSRNLGRGRHSRRQRYAEGRSY